MIQGWHFVGTLTAICVSASPSQMCPVKHRPVTGFPLTHLVGNDGPGPQGRASLLLTLVSAHGRFSRECPVKEEHGVDRSLEICLPTGAKLRTGTLTSTEALPGPPSHVQCAEKVAEALGPARRFAPALAHCRDHVLSPYRSPLCRQTLTSKASCPRRP